MKRTRMDELFSSTSRFRVRYAETDAMRIVHHSSYIVWFEEGRSEYMRQIGFPYTNLEAMGLYLAVTEVHARYLRAAKYDEEVLVETHLQNLRSRGLTFYYRVLKAADGELLTEGETVHICIDDENRPRRLPKEVYKLLKPFAEGE